MDRTRFWEPRNRPAAAKVAGGFICAAAAIGLVFTPLTSRAASAPALLLAYVLPLALIVLSALLIRFPHRAPACTWLLVPNAGLAVTAGLNIATHDASVGAQLFFLFPVFYASSQLRAPAAYGTAVFAACCQGGSVLLLQPPERALTDFFYFAVTLACLSVLQVTAVSRQDALVVQLRRLADVDPLTGLVTRRAMVNATEAALVAGNGGGTAVLFIDVDHFKVVNDTYGHRVGDGVLTHLADLLSSQVRATDTVGRLGGDELVILMPDCASELAHARAERLVEAVRRSPYRLPDGTPLLLSVSLGVGYVPPGQSGSPDGLYELADEALYDAKRAGRGRVGEARPHAARAGGEQPVRFVGERLPMKG